jgi:hypothetical protein
LTFLSDGVGASPPGNRHSSFLRLQFLQDGLASSHFTLEITFQHHVGEIEVEIDVSILSGFARKTTRSSLAMKATGRHALNEDMRLGEERARDETSRYTRCWRRRAVNYQSEWHRQRVLLGALSDGRTRLRKCDELPRSDYVRELCGELTTTYRLAHDVRTSLCRRRLSVCSLSGRIQRHRIVEVTT